MKIYINIIFGTKIVMYLTFMRIKLDKENTKGIGFMFYCAQTMLLYNNIPEKHIFTVLKIFSAMSPFYKLQLLDKINITYLLEPWLTTPGVSPTTI